MNARLAAAAFAFALGGCSAVPIQRPAVVYLTDFGTADGAVAAMKGVALGVDSSLVLHDLTHEVPPFDVWQAAYRLHQTARYWPAGTVFVCVVDPDVGTKRRAIVATDRDGRLYVTPDNGTLTLLGDSGAIAETRVLDAERLRLEGSDESHTFHGRDVFSLVGARLAAGALAFEDVGETTPPGGLLRLAHPSPRAEQTSVGPVLYGSIPALDVRFGNVWTDVPVALAEREGMTPGGELLVDIRHRDREVFSGRVPYVRTFGDVPRGSALVYGNSLGNLSLAVNQGSFAKGHAVDCGPDWTITFRRP